MQLNETIKKIAQLREETQSAIDSLWEMRDTLNPHELNVADYLHYELTAIVCKFTDLEETETTEDFTPTENDDADEAETIADWWTDLDLCDKCELANVPMPTTNYGRGDEYCECEERCDKWWHSRTLEQKREIYAENLAWWDKE